MKERLETIITKYEELKQELTKPEVLADYNKLRTLSKEQKDLESIVTKYKEYLASEKNIEDAKILANDPEMHELAEETLAEETANKERL